MWNFSLIKCQILTAKFHMCVMKDCDRFRQTPNECLLFHFTMKKSHTHTVHSTLFKIYWTNAFEVITISLTRHRGKVNITNN